MKRYAALRALFWPAATWPLLSLLGIALLWFATIARNESDAALLQRNALRDVASYTQAYENFLTRSVSQMDQITMQLKVDWEKSKGQVNFEDLHRQGMFTDTAFLSVAIYDASGVRRTSTNAGGAAATVAPTEYFEFHKNNISTAVSMSLPSGESGARRQIIFSRRLDGADDRFDGLVVLVIDADYFTSFYNAGTFGQNGLVAMVADDDDRLVERDGTPLPGDMPLLLHPHDAFSQDEGAALQGAQIFRDRRPRFAAWHQSSIYPFISVVALSRDEVVGPSAAVARDRITTAALGSLALFAFAIVASVLSMRLASRKSEAENVRSAYRMATDNANDGFYMVSPVHGEDGAMVDFTIADCNERGASFYGMKRAALLQTLVSHLPVGPHADAIVQLCIDTMRSGYHQTEVQMPRQSLLQSGRQVEWVQQTLVRAGSGLAVTLHDISRHKRHERDLLRLANEDALTGLPNRYWLLNHLPAAMRHAAGASQRLALLFIDLDGFKHVNDTQGHAIGDSVLQVAATRLKSLLRPTDSVVRFGGDEFIVLLDPLESDDQVVIVAQRIVTAFGTPFKIGDETLAVGASVGISLYPRDASDAMTLIKNSDIAMYAGKSSGKGQYRFYEEALYQSLKSSARAKQDLLEALGGDQLVLHFQPRVDARSGELRSMEALVRWMHPQRGMVPPLEFIPLAESCGLICAIGEIVMEKACRQLAQWARDELPVVPVSINVSPLQFAGGQVHRQLEEHLTRHGVAAALLEVEITESGMMEDQLEVLNQLASIRALGIKLHIDDFGTGYSSLSQLQRLKMDVLKVDRAFTSELGKSGDGTVFFQAIVSMAHALGMAVVAEGVETPEQLAILQTLDCDEVQGYLISRPVPAAEMGLLLERRYLFGKAVAA